MSLAIIYPVVATIATPFCSQPSLLSFRLLWRPVWTAVAHPSGSQGPDVTRQDHRFQNNFAGYIIRNDTRSTIDHRAFLGQQEAFVIRCGLGFGLGLGLGLHVGLDFPAADGDLLPLAIQIATLLTAGGCLVALLGAAGLERLPVETYAHSHPPSFPPPPSHSHSHPSIPPSSGPTQSFFSYSLIFKQNPSGRVAARGRSIAGTPSPSRSPESVRWA